MDLADARQMILKLGILMIAMVLIEAGCNYFITYFGHMMGVFIERI